MTAMISFRPDERTAAELRELARGRDRSAVMREIVHKAWVEQKYAQAQADADRLRNDPADREELAAIAEEMGDADAW